MELLQQLLGVTKLTYSRKVLGKPTVEGESPVGEMSQSLKEVFPSRAEHVEFRLNLGGPSSKAKYH